MKPFQMLARFGLFIIFAVLILWLSLDSNPPVPKWEFIAWDKAQHALAYGMLTLLAGGALAVLHKSPLRVWILAFTFSLSYGILLEFLQKYFSPTRQFEIGDMVADGIGSLIVAVVAFYWFRFGFALPGRGK